MKEILCVNKPLKQLWLVRANPDRQNRIEEFFDLSIIAIGWPNIPDMTGQTKEDIRISLIQGTKYTGKDANLKVGLINHFLNNMQIGDWCLVPDRDDIYLAEITGDYYYSSAHKKEGFPHQRSVKWLNNQEPFHRFHLPKKIQTSLRTQLTVANLSEHMELLQSFIENNHTIYGYDLNEELLALVPKAIQTLKKEIDSDDPNRRLQASIAVLQFINNHNIQ